MGLNCGIVGPPNVGKSTIFSSLTSDSVAIENYPFCTIEPNVGVVPINDHRLRDIANFITPRKIIPTTIEFADIAGLVKGASHGEGLGNQFLSSIRNVNAIIHVVRCFEDDNIAHVNGEVDPINDIETINMELALADLEVVQRRLDNISKLIKSHDPKVKSRALSSMPVLEKLQKHLEEGVPAITISLDKDEYTLINDLNLITLKKTLYVCNIDEESVAPSGNHWSRDVDEFVRRQGAESIAVCGKLESELATLESLEDRQELMSGIGVSESGLDKLIASAYRLLGLKTFFTAGEKEIRAWTYRDGSTAPETAGIIHSDFERGFIKAEVYHYNDLIHYKSETKVKEAGKLRVEGRDYLVKDGDIIHFRFNV